MDGPWLKYCPLETRNIQVFSTRSVQQVNICFEVDKIDDEELHVYLDVPELWPSSVKPSHNATA